MVLPQALVCEGCGFGCARRRREQYDYVWPGGESFSNQGVYLAVEEGKRLAFTDAFTSAWIPSG